LYIPLFKKKNVSLRKRTKTISNGVHNSLTFYTITLCNFVVPTCSVW